MGVSGTLEQLLLGADLWPTVPGQTLLPIAGFQELLGPVPRGWNGFLAAGQL